MEQCILFTRGTIGSGKEAYLLSAGRHGTVEWGQILDCARGWIYAPNVLASLLAHEGGWDVYVGDQALLPAVLHDIEARMAAQMADPAMPSELLAEAASYTVPALQRLIAANPNTPTAGLLQLAAHFPAEVMHNPVIPLLLLENPRFLQEFDDAALFAFLRCGEWPPQLRPLLSALRHHPNRELRREIRGHIAIAGALTEDWQEACKQAIATFTFPEGKDGWRGFANVFAMPAFMAPWLVETLAKHNSPIVRAKIAALPDLRPDWRERLAHDPVPTVRQRIAQRADLPVVLQYTLAQDSDSGVRQMLANNIHTAASLLEHLAKEPDRKVRRQVAMNLHTPPLVLEQLADDSFILVQRTVAYHPHLSSAALGRLAGHEDRHVRQHVAVQAQLPFAALVLLADDEEPMVRERVAMNPQATSKILARLADDAAISVRRKVAAHPNTPTTILAQFARDSQRILRAAVATNLATPDESVAALRQDNDYHVRMAATRDRLLAQVHAWQPQDSIAALAAFAHDTHVSVRCAVASHPHVPKALVSVLVEDREPIVFLPLLDQAYLPPDVLDRLVERVVANPAWLRNRQLDMAARLSHHPQMTDALRAALYSAFATTKLGAILPASDSPLLTTIAFLTIPSLPVDMLARFANAPRWIVRYTVGCHPNCDATLLQLLAEDGNRYVRAASIARLHFLS